MKRLLIILGLGLTIGMAKVNTVEAQVVNVYVNIDLQPAWGPAGYNYAAFYFFPALNIYYDVNHALFYYLSGRRWISSYYLPIRYQRYDFYTMYKVVINDYHNPWLYNRAHRRSYASYRNIRTQMPIRSMTADRRYIVARTNTRAWVEQRPTPATTNRLNRSTVTRTPPNTQNRNTSTTTQNRSTSTTTQSRNAATSQNRNTSATTQNRNAATIQNRITTNGSSVTTQSSGNQTNRNAAASSATQTRDNLNQRNNQTGNSQNTTTRNSQSTTTTRSSSSESRNTSTSVGRNR